MGTLSKLLQLLGLVIVPMAILYYAFNRDRVIESKLMFGELSLLALGSMLFLVGRSMGRR